MKEIKLLLADDHYLVRKGIKALLEKIEDLEIIGEAGDGLEAVSMTKNLQPDVVIMDINMKQLNGIQATEQITALDPGTKIVILSMHSDKNLVQRALRSGASGYVLKRALTEELILAIRSACAGDIYLSPGVSKHMVSMFIETQEPEIEQTPFDSLTPREKQVTQLISEGNTTKGIASILGVSDKTIEKHRRNSMSKLKVHDVASLTRLAIKHGLIFLDD